jgi:hypothetical protein
MFGIVLGHSLGSVINLGHENKVVDDNWFYSFLTTFHFSGGFGNAIFFLIGGFFIGKAGRTNIKRMHKIITPCLFYACVFLLVAIISGADWSYPFSEVYDFFNFFLFDGLWYPVGYIGYTLLLTPFVRRISSLKIGWQIALCVVLFVAGQIVTSTAARTGWIPQIPFVATVVYSLCYLWIMVAGIVIYSKLEFFGSSLN